MAGLLLLLGTALLILVKSDSLSFPLVPSEVSRETFLSLGLQPGSTPAPCGVQQPRRDPAELQPTAVVSTEKPSR